jgi:uncharacterized membrane protein
MKVLFKHTNLVGVILLFGLLYSLISLVNHYYFRTYALDLGAYTNALYDYTRFQWNDSTVFKETAENLLADHFDLYLVLFSPFSFILGTYTLLIIQIIFILFGGLGIYCFFRLTETSAFLPLSAAVYFYLFFGVFSAVAYDYHSNVIAASLIPWLFYLIIKRKIFTYSALFVLILVSKENISLFLMFVCIGLAIDFRSDTLLTKILIFSAIVSGIYFVSITSIIMPAISNAGAYPHFHYSFLGSNYREAFFHVVSHPLESLNVLFTNHNNSVHGDYVKAELHILLISSGLPLLLKKPQYLLMLLPIYFQKLFHDNYSMWGIGGQYNVEFAPIMAIGIFKVVAEFKRVKSIRIVSSLILIFTLGSTIRIMDQTVFFTNKSCIRFYNANHYKRDYNVRKVHYQLSLIPKNAIVSAQSPFLPHLSLRDQIFQFPIIKDADYIIYSEKEDCYPLEKSEFDSITSKLKSSVEWVVIYDKDLTILKKRI